MPTAALRQTTSKPSNRLPASLRDRLRGATASEHEALDRQLAALDLGKRDDYRLFLEISAAALLPIETALTAGGVERYFPDWPARERGAAILADLDRLGGTMTPLATPDLDGGRLFGAMYALEGSRLGARYLLRAVEASTDARVADATGYLAHGAGGRLWPTFLTGLEALEADIDETDAVQGARIVFALFADAAAARLVTRDAA